MARNVFIVVIVAFLGGCKSMVPVLDDYFYTRDEFPQEGIVFRTNGYTEYVIHDGVGDGKTRYNGNFTIRGKIILVKLTKIGKELEEQKWVKPPIINRLENNHQSSSVKISIDIKMNAPPYLPIQNAKIKVRNKIGISDSNGNSEINIPRKVNISNRPGIIEIKHSAFKEVRILTSLDSDLKIEVWMAPNEIFSMPDHLSLKLKQLSSERLMSIKSRRFFVK